MGILRDFWYSYTPEYRFYLVVVALFIPLTIAGFIAQIKVNSTFSRCAVRAGCGLTAAEVARRILDRNGLYNTKIVRISGHLTDNFNPVTNTLSLSQSVYGANTVNAIGVACHEAGHAIQHARKYVFSSLRLKLVPVVNLANRALFPLLLIGMLLGFASPYTTIGRVFIWIGVVVFGLSMLFSLVTLPTEFDASRRAQKELRDGFLTPDEAALSKKVLTAAAMTYVVSFLLSLVQFLRFFALLLM
ncbi:MAG: zinc metallopeptidase, partial [Clostridiales bacterium]|nr:zinc metallopeptidase [Clostridiales bacterium]